MKRVPYSLALLWLLAFQVASSGAAVDEQVREMRIEPGVRVLINHPASIDPAKPTTIVFYACPTGNTIEQTFGRAPGEGVDWRHDIQHAGAQIRRLREVDPGRNIVLVLLEAEGKSWPAWRAKYENNGAVIRDIVATVSQQLAGGQREIVLTGHSGGGSFITGYINGGERIADDVARIAYLDANYSFDAAAGHGEKLLAWLRGDDRRHLVVIAYDDREISLDGKKVVSDTGGTWRATHRMIGAIRGEFELEHSLRGDFDLYRGMNEQVQLLLHRNPQNTILHTVLVGEMNGLLHALTVGTALEEAWGVFGGPRAYTRWISAHGPGSIHAGSYGPRSGSASVIKTAAEHESAPGPGTGPAGCRSEGGGAVEGIPARAQDAPGGRALMREVAQLPLEQREQVLFEQIVAGNVPVFLREFKTIRVRNDLGEAEIRVSPDYFAVGSDNDFVRVPLTPMAAQRIADRFGWSLPTRKIVDDVYREAQVKLEPQPMTENREAVETFVEHNDIIEAQRREQPLGLLIAGIKKDVVISNRLNEKPQRVAIYGWHQPGGKPIQPLTTVHRETYVDYSHGIRFVEGVVRVDGRAMQLDEVLRDEKLSPLLSDEGPITPTRYEAPPTARPAER